jgi:hypothetical protein
MKKIMKKINEKNKKPHKKESKPHKKNSGVLTVR